MRVGSLFTGYGGLDQAVCAVTGARTAWVSDIDKGANRILAHRYADVPNIGDITKVDWDAVEPVDILTGGFPCQDLSHAGKRQGLRPDTRSGLWLHMAYAIEQLRPQLVVAENVRGLLSAKTAESREVVTVGPKGGRKVGHTDRALGRVLSDLADLGYDARWFGLRAADVGAPHARFRVFVVAHPNGVGLERPRLSRVGWDGPAYGSQSDLTLLPTPRASRGASTTETFNLLPTPAVNDMGAGKTVEDWDAWTARMKEAHGNGNGHGKSLSIEAQRLLPTPTRRDWKDGPYVANVEENALLGRAVWPLEHNFGAYTDAVSRWADVRHTTPPSPTEPTGRDGAHRLSPRFVEWMMGLAAGWVTDVPGLSRNDQLKALGNGVVPQQAVAALQAMLSA